MACPNLILPVVFVWVSMSHQSQNVIRRIFTNASTETKYSGKVADGEEDIYHFTLPKTVLQNSVRNIHN